MFRILKLPHFRQSIPRIKKSNNLFDNVARSTVFRQTTRDACQLYPTTSHRWDEAMLQAESIVGDASDFSNLQKWVSGEFSNITKYLERLVGTNHPMLETAKRCTYISEGRMGSAQARGLTVILTSKAVESLSKHSSQRGAHALIRDQISLAEMTEMTYSAYMIHRGVMDLKMHGLESVGNNESSIQQAKGIHYGNKVSVLCGDFLLAYVMRGLGDLFSSKVVDLVSTAITDFMEGEFLLIDDWRSENYLLSPESRDLKRWEQRSYSSVGSLQGNTCRASLVLGGIHGGLEHDAQEFGKNLGLAWQAHTELQPFLQDNYEPIELPEMPPFPAFDLNCLPVLLFLRNSYPNRREFNIMIQEIKGRKKSLFVDDTVNQHRHQEQVDYERLHSLILDQGEIVDQAYRLIEGYSRKAIRHLESFPPSDAKDVLEKICRSMYRD